MALNRYLVPFGIFTFTFIYLIVSHLANSEDLSWTHLLVMAVEWNNTDAVLLLLLSERKKMSLKWCLTTLFIKANLNIWKRKQVNLLIQTIINQEYVFLENFFPKIDFWRNIYNKKTSVEVSLKIKKYYRMRRNNKKFFFVVSFSSKFNFECLINAFIELEKILWKKNQIIKFKYVLYTLDLWILALLSKWNYWQCFE